jgi:hypothetical protein
MEMDSSGINRKTILENELEKKRFSMIPKRIIPENNIKSKAEFSKRYQLSNASIMC